MEKKRDTKVVSIRSVEADQQFKVQVLISKVL